jgi:hypothetical protein
VTEVRKNGLCDMFIREEKLILDCEWESARESCGPL